MSSSIRALVASAGIDTFEVQRGLPDDAPFELVGIVAGADEAIRGIQSRSPDILLVASDGEGVEAVQIIEGAQRVEPDLPILVLSTSSPNGFLRRAFDAGAADVVLFPQGREGLEFALNKAMARRGRKIRERGEGDSRLIAVLGPKGGTGKTLTTCNLAVGLAQNGQRVLVVDLDLQFGDVALCMGLPPEKTLYDLAVSPGSFDEDKLADYVVKHPSGVDALLAPSRPDQASAVTVELLRDVYGVARSVYDFIVVDTPPGFTAEVIATIDSSTDLVMVGMLDSLSLKNTKLGLETLQLMGYDADLITLVLNRAHSRVGISQSDVIAVLGREPQIYIPSDREIPRAINEGVPVILARPGSEPAVAFRQLATMYAGGESTLEVTADLDKGKRRLFGRR